MSRDPKDDLIRDLADPESAAIYGAELLKTEVALALVRARMQAWLTQAELAERVGCSQAYIAQLESGEANPTLSRVGAVLAAAGYTVKWELRPLVERSEP